MHLHRPNAGYARGRARPTAHQKQEQANKQQMIHAIDFEPAIGCGGVDSDFETCDSHYGAVPLTDHLVAHVDFSGGGSRPHIERRAA